MDWERVHVWTSTLYTLIHSLHLAKAEGFGDLQALDGNVRDAAQWVPIECSYGSVLLGHPFGKSKITFRREPSRNFEKSVAQLIKMLIQDLVVIFDGMMDQVLTARGESGGEYPLSR